MSCKTCMDGFTPAKIKISGKLFNSVITLLENLDYEDLSPETIKLYGYVLYGFKSKSYQSNDAEPF